jgi:dephospho-CoA kinase
VLLVGLTGGIGSGKSTVAGMLESRGAVVIDADDLARRAIQPGTPGYDRVIGEFGSEAATSSGDVNREWLAERVFADPGARARLESIVHPEVARLFAEETEPYRLTDRIVVYAVPLLAENRLEGAFDVVVVVSADAEVRVARLAARGVTDAGARMDAQASDRERERLAHFVLRNDGSVEELERQVDRLWAELRR